LAEQTKANRKTGNRVRTMRRLITLRKMPEKEAGWPAALFRAQRGIRVQYVHFTHDVHSRGRSGRGGPIDHTAAVSALRSSSIAFSKYSIESRRPAARSIFGSQFSRRLALPMSGRRCLGSSTGSGSKVIRLFEP